MARWRMAWVGVAAAVALSGCVALGRPPLAACVGAFEATVRQGPSAGLALQGELAYIVTPTGTVRGALRLDDGAHIQFTGQADGRAVNLAFAVDADTYVFGVGTSTEDVRQCSGVWGGPLVGPRPGDTGDWLGGGGQSCPVVIDSGPFSDLERVAPLSESPFSDDESAQSTGCNAFPASGWFYDEEPVDTRFSDFFSDDETKLEPGN